MARRWVVNASPLIALSKIEHLMLLDALSDEIVVPNAVLREIAAGAGASTLVPAVTALRNGRVETVAIIDPDVLRWDLGAGEGEVLSWARQHAGFEAIVDDRAARSCAATLAIPVRGTLGLVLLAKRDGHLPAVAPLIEALRAQGAYLDQHVVDAVLALAGE